MGWIRVGDIGLSRSEWCASDVMTKCYCFPDSMTQRSTNPLPPAVRQATDLLERTRQYNRTFDKADVLKWNIVPLLQPPKTVLGRMVAFIRRCDRMAHVVSPMIWVWHFLWCKFIYWKIFAVRFIFTMYLLFTIWVLFDLNWFYFDRCIALVLWGTLMQVFKHSCAVRCTRFIYDWFSLLTDM